VGPIHRSEFIGPPNPHHRHFPVPLMPAPSKLFVSPARGALIRLPAGTLRSQMESIPGRGRHRVLLTTTTPPVTTPPSFLGSPTTTVVGERAIPAARSMVRGAGRHLWQTTGGFPQPLLGPRRPCGGYQIIPSHARPQNCGRIALRDARPPPPLARRKTRIAREKVHGPTRAQTIVVISVQAGAASRAPAPQAPSVLFGPCTNFEKTLLVKPWKKAIPAESRKALPYCESPAPAAAEALKTCPTRVLTIASGSHNAAARTVRQGAFPGSAET